MESKCIDILKVNQFPDYDILYCDPPWGAPYVKLFETMMFKQTGIKQPGNNIYDILNRLGKLANKNKPLFIEYSVKDCHSVIDIMTNYGHKLTQSINFTQSNYERPYKYMSFNTNIILPDGLKGWEGLTLILKTLKPKTVFDPFAGIGVTAKVVLKNNCRYIGYELNPKRFERLCNYSIS